MQAFGGLWPGAAAVSGGSDSLALMFLLADWSKKNGLKPPWVLTVDHGLYSGSSEEAERVRNLAEHAGLPSAIFTWEGSKPTSNVEAQARIARYQLIGRWCMEHDCSALYIGHTVEDQAETFLLRLGRGSGVDGLAAMQPVAPIPIAGFDPVVLARPLLEFRREELRRFLGACGIQWFDDPMNADQRFARARVRASWAVLEEIGVSPERIAAAADHLGRARDALEQVTGILFASAVRLDGTSATLDGTTFKALPREIGLRLLAKVLSVISGQEYRPRFVRLERLYDAVCGGLLGRGATLSGCFVAPAPRREQIFGPATLRIVPERPKEAKKAAPEL